MTTRNPDKTPPPLPRNPEPPPVSGDGSSLPLDEEVMDVSELEPEGAPSDDFEANARQGIPAADDFIADDNASTGPPDEQIETAEDLDEDDEA